VKGQEAQAVLTYGRKIVNIAGKFIEGFEYTRDLYVGYSYFYECEVNTHTLALINSM